MGLISNTPLVVELSREPGDPWVVLTLPDGKSEELDPDACREWFRLRNANVDAVEHALDEVWNFGKAAIEIVKPRTLNSSIDPLDPKL